MIPLLLVFKIKMVEDFYDERSARDHIRRIREILISPPKQISHKFILMGMSGSKSKEDEEEINPNDQQQQSLTTTSTIDKEEQEQVDDNESSNIMNIEKFYYDDEFTLTSKRVNSNNKKLLKNIQYSAYNPVPGYRRILGDLLYLEVLTLEDNLLHITCAVDGFYINQSTNIKFNALPALQSYKSHNLCQLLKKSSPLFKSYYIQLLNNKTEEHPFESVPYNSATSYKEWIKYPQLHTYDWNRAETALINNYGMDESGANRDWNEEWQHLRHKSSLNKFNPLKEGIDPLVMERTKIHCYKDFVNAAVQGTQAIIHGNILPINPHETKDKFMYMYNRIFFTYAIDFNNKYLDHEIGNKLAYKNASHDLHSISKIGQIYTSYFQQQEQDVLDGDVNGDDNNSNSIISTVATVVITYAGYRMVAQSIPAGMLHGESNLTTLLYGTADDHENNQAISDQDFHQRVCNQLSQHFALKEHQVINYNQQQEEEEEVSLYTSFESKGFKCPDGRIYLLDLHRMNPRDANFYDENNIEKDSSKLLRNELIDLYIQSEKNKVTDQIYKEYTEQLFVQKAQQGESGTTRKRRRTRTKKTKKTI